MNDEEAAMPDAVTQDAAATDVAVIVSAPGAGVSEPIMIGLIVILLAVGLVAGVVRGRRQGAAVKRGREEAQDREASALEAHHRPRWQSDPRAFEPLPVHWGLALAAPFSLCWGDEWDALRSSRPEEKRDILRESWGVVDRASLVDQLYSLLVSGHRAGFDAERAGWAALDPELAGRVETGLRRGAKGDEDTVERLWRFRRMRADDRGIRSVDFTAWDFVRFAMLVRAGVSSGYLSDAEAEDALLLPVDDLRSRYRGWDELGEAFLMGRWYWHSVAGEQERETDAHDRSRQLALLGANGPWRAVPWELPVSPSRFLIVDALLESGSIEPLSGAVRENGPPWAIRFDDAVRERMGRA